MDRILQKETQANFASRMTIIKKDFKLHKPVYFLFLPVLIYYIIFYYGPMYGTIIAFKDFTPHLGFLGSPWAGFKHFVKFFSIPSFKSVLGNTLKISLATLALGFPMPIILALLLNELKSPKLSRIVQNATYLPHFISLVVVCGMVRDFTRDTGVVTQMLSYFGVPKVSLLNYPQYFLPVYVVSEIWQNTGWASIVYLAALTGIDASLYEAATIDGANRWKQLWNITIPGILPTIIIMLILRIGQMMNVGYEKILLLSNDAILDVSDVISTYVYRTGLLNQSWSFSAAVGMFNSVINLILLISTNTLSRKINDISLW